MNIVIDIDNRQDIFDFTKQEIELIEKAVASCYQLEKYPETYQVSISFVNNDEIQQLNRQYRGKNEPTDVLSFPMSFDDPAVEEKLLGDIVISTEKMLKQAREFGHGVKREMIYLVVHSVFHLMGYNHLDDESKEIMRLKEEQVMTLMNLAE
ncbi:MAG: rRNA maturation RNase YbeY [Tindallia sp. MSAO_Bac2]|nr:MAG: rRNA maturation RNase YbeY [Tindallia sp. MSAO_Bac2]